MRLVRPFELILLKPPTPPPDAHQVAAFERDWSSHVTDELTLFTYATARWRGIDTALKHLLQQVSAAYPKTSCSYFSCQAVIAHDA